MIPRPVFYLNHKSSLQSAIHLVSCNINRSTFVYPVLIETVDSETVILSLSSPVGNKPILLSKTETAPSLLGKNESAKNNDTYILTVSDDHLCPVERDQCGIVLFSEQIA